MLAQVCVNAQQGGGPRQQSHADSPPAARDESGDTVSHRNTSQSSLIGLSSLASWFPQSDSMSQFGVSVLVASLI